MRRRLHILIAASAAALGAFAISTAMSSGDSPASSAERSGTTMLPAVTAAPSAVAPEIAARYAIFRRAARSTDIALIRSGSFAARQQGVAVDQARLISEPTASWRASVVPSASGACIFVLTADMAAPGGGCGTQAEVLAGLLTTSVGDVAAGLVPDDVEIASVNYDDGSSQQLPISNNAYSIKLTKPTTSVSYNSPSLGKMTVPIA